MTKAEKEREKWVLEKMVGDKMFWANVQGSRNLVERMRQKARDEYGKKLAVARTAAYRIKARIKNRETHWRKMAIEREKRLENEKVHKAFIAQFNKSIR